MKKRYKVKEVNKTKLKSYLSNANTKNSTGQSRGGSSKRNSSRVNDI
tara:strand:- start:687 stop:827 length:141 start_codon:yes stop_codon:yes gene_type:complete